jgi:ubiquinone/menaquinone biosynthesis C-methylase UbiE
LAADYGQLTRNLSSFYDFTGKLVLFVGAGGRQLLDPSIATRKLIAIDRDVESLRELKAKCEAQGMHDSVDIVGCDFKDVRSFGDVVYFEFCLHEMGDPTQALLHASTLALDIVVFDHLPESEWVFHAAEEDQV